MVCSGSFTEQLTVNTAQLTRCFSKIFIPSALFTLDTSFSSPKSDKANRK